MPRGEKDPNNREVLRRQFGALYEEVQSIVFRHDPVGINFEVNPDEYDPEVSAIVPKVVHAQSPDEVQQIVREEFEHWFGPGQAFREESFEPIATQVFAAVLRYRAL
jgi:hypothetical protein